MMTQVAASIRQLAQQPDFWHFQAKDLITLLIALAAFLTAATNVWVAYIRPRRLKCELSNTLRVFYSQRPDHLLRFLIDVVAINTGARPGVITGMAIHIVCATDRSKEMLVRWREILTNENIAEKGEARKISTKFLGFASAVLVPKYDARLIEAAFYADRNYDLQEGLAYNFRLLYWLDNKNECFRGTEKNLTITTNIFKFLESKATANEKGITERLLFTTSTDGSTFLPPPAANLMQTEIARTAPHVLHSPGSN
jgi:hypothetical protein